VFKNGETTLLFLNRVLQWLTTPMVYGRVINLFSKFDSDKDNMLSPDDFAVAMRMMEVSMPINIIISIAIRQPCIGIV